MVTVKKVDIWTPIISIIGIILIVFFSLNVASNRETKERLKELQNKEQILKAALNKNKQKIDSLESEIEKRDSLLNQTVINNHTLQQFKDKYADKINNIIAAPIDSDIVLFSREVNY